MSNKITVTGDNQTQMTNRRKAKPKIVFDNATKIYKTQSGEVHALDNVRATIYEGEFVCIVGPSGCGKTTLLWGISGLHPLTSGEIRLEDDVIRGPHPEIGMIFQQANLLPWRTVLGNIEFPFEIKKLNPRDYRDGIQHLLEEVGLAGFDNKYPHELSGGMQQRVSLVRCLAMDPSVMLMDEPFGALDAFTRDEMNLLLLKLWQEQQKTVVFVTHSIQEALFLSDRIIVLSARPGRVEREYPVELPRPRQMEMQTSPYFIQATVEIKELIYASM